MTRPAGSASGVRMSCSEGHTARNSASTFPKRAPGSRATRCGCRRRRSGSSRTRRCGSAARRRRSPRSIRSNRLKWRQPTAPTGRTPTAGSTLPTIARSPPDGSPIVCSGNWRTSGWRCGSSTGGRERRPRKIGDARDTPRLRHEVPGAGILFFFGGLSPGIDPALGRSRECGRRGPSPSVSPGTMTFWPGGGGAIQARTDAGDSAGPGHLF